MAAEIEAEPVALLRPREPADEFLALQDEHAATPLRQVQRRGKAGRTGP
jgi:hypothetical protein